MGMWPGIGSRTMRECEDMKREWCERRESVDLVGQKAREALRDARSQERRSRAESFNREALYTLSRPLQTPRTLREHNYGNNA